MKHIRNREHESDYEKITSVLTSTQYAEPFMERFVLEALGSMGKIEEMKARMLDRYAGMIASEVDTVWEKFDKNDGTFNHDWSASPLYVTDKYLVGIRPTSAD